MAMVAALMDSVYVTQVTMVKIVGKSNYNSI